jgi:N4 Gp49/Sf6 Gp66 family protein
MEGRAMTDGIPLDKITMDHLEGLIKDEEYHLFPGSSLTVCCLTLENGWHATGESACVKPENFNADLGRTIARTRALNSVFALEGYLLRDQWHKFDRAVNS